MPLSTGNPPNILWIYIEDQDPRYGCYGEKLVNTPNIDALATEGVLFQRAYSPAPVCSPSRSAIITGSDAIRVGAQHQRSRRFSGEEIYLPDGVETVPEVFRKAGYFTFNRGKDDYNFVYDRTKLYSTGNTGVDPGKLKGVQAGKGNWSECPEGMPFFAQIQTWGGKHAYSHGDLSAYMTTVNAKAVDPADVTVPPQYPDIPEMRELIAGQLSTMMISDYEVGEIINKLKDDGLWENTVIFLISDHGSLLPRAKQFCYEEGLHIPLIIAAPGMQATIPPGSERSEQTALLDVAGTSLALACIEIPEYMDTKDLFAEDFEREHVFASRDRCEWAIDRTRSVIGKRYHYMRNFMTDRPLAQSSYRSKWPAFVRIQEMHDRGELTDAQALPYGERPAEELYDLHNDPHELVNLVDDADHRAILTEMHKLLDAWIEDTGDKGQFPESEAALRIVKQQFPELAIGPEFRDL